MNILCRKYLTLAILTMFLLSLIPLSLKGKTDKPKIFVDVSPQVVIVGQPVTVKVTVLVPTWLLGAPEFPNIDLPGAITILSNERAQNVSKDIGGSRWSGIARSYVIYPQEEKSYQLPKANVGVVYSVGGIEKSPKTNVTIPKVTFKAVIPTEARKLEYFIATVNLEIKQKFDKKLAHLKVGDSFKRTITITTKKSLAMFIPPLQIDSLEGIKIYFDEPIVTNKTENRVGFIAGERIEEVTYFIEKPGDYELPEIKIYWWNLNSKKIVTSKLKTIKFHADSNASYVSELAIIEDSTQTSIVEEKNVQKVDWEYIVILLIAFVLVIIFRKQLKILVIDKPANWIEERKERALNSEKNYFNMIKKACSKNDLNEIKISFSNWLTRISDKENDLDVKQLSEITNNKELLQYSQQLDTILFGKNGYRNDWNCSKFLDLVKRSRREYLKVDAIRNKPDIIPPLNPKT